VASGEAGVAFLEGDDAKNLQSLVDSESPDPEAILAHPAIVNAARQASQRLPTFRRPGYGTALWWINRRFEIPGRSRVGVSEAYGYLVDKARSYAGQALAYEAKAVIVIGPPGAGKSTVAVSLARELHAALVDCDDAKAILPEYEGGLGANAVHEESTELWARVFREFYEAAANFVLPKVGASVASIRQLINNLKALGYSVRLVLVAVSYAEAVRRMAQRFLTTGRLIDPAYVREVGEKPRQTYLSLREEGAADQFEEMT
jgi:predicted ABC-type ATPase